MDSPTFATLITFFDFCPSQRKLLLISNYSLLIKYRFTFFLIFAL